MQNNSFGQLYLLKSDDDLLALAADRDSLVEEARYALAAELQRRNLTEAPLPVRVKARSAMPAFLTRLRDYAMWLGLCLLNTLVATVGVAMSVGALTYSTESFVSRAARIYLVQTPYYPLPIMLGLVVGYFSHTRFKGSYRYWAWVVPAVFVLVFLISWRTINPSSWSEATVHFFGHIPYPGNRDQLGTSRPFVHINSLFAWCSDPKQGTQACNHRYHVNSAGLAE